MAAELKTLHPRILIQGLYESARSLGIAQEKKDQPAIQHWQAQADAHLDALKAQLPSFHEDSSVE